MGARPMMLADRSGQAARRALFEPTSAWPLAIARVVLGATVFVWSLTMLIDVSSLLGADAVVGPEFADPTWSWLPDGDTWPVVTALIALMVSSVAVILGVRPTTFLVVSFVLLVAVQRRNPTILNSGDLILRNLTLLLALCPTGAAMSLDRVRRLGRGSLFTAADVAPWGLRLVQLQVVVVYFFAFWSKSGGSWRDGTAVSTALRLDDLQRIGRFDLLIESVPLVALATWGTLAVELALAMLLWCKPLRPWLIVAALALHLSIDSLLLVGFFGLAMMAGLATFLDGDAIERLVAARRNARSADGQAEADVGAPVG
ncbi:MAG: HTTM domain-containing protein [Ilumatobacter sp.]